MFPAQVISQKSLGERLLFPKSTLSTSVDGLVTLGFLKRSIPEENRREVELELTEAGREQVLLMHNEPNGVYQKMMGVLSQLSEESIHTLLELHQQLYELMIDTETTENGEDARC
jgi:DNA-binding MarR family transcriptional regulator